MKEIWKDVPNYEGLYQVSNLGNIISLNYNGTKKSKKIKELEQKNGYVRVILYKNKNRKTCLIHRLVALTFIPNPENKATVNHKNGIKTDNRVENLEWATYRENEIHSIEILKRNRNTKKQRESAITIGKTKRKLAMEQAKEIRKKCKKMSRKELSKRYKVSLSTIDKIINNKTYIH